MLFVIRTGPKLCVGGAVDVLHSNSLSDLSEATDLATHLPRAYVVNQEFEQRPHSTTDKISDSSRSPPVFGGITHSS